MHRSVLAIVSAIVITAVVAIGIGISTPSNAAVVNGTGLGTSVVQSDLEAVAGNSAYLCYLNASALVRSNGNSGLSAVAGASTGTYSSNFVTLWTNQEITRTLLEAQAISAGLPAPSAADLAQARIDLTSSIDSTLAQVAGSQYQCPTAAQALLAGMPKAFVDRQVAAQALSEAFLARSAGISISPSAVKAYYDANTSMFDKVCVSGILLSSKASADSVKAQLDGGADFSTLASQDSIDPQSKARGGVIGCFDPTSSQYQAVLTDVGSLGVGAVTAPMPSQGGAYVLLTVTSRTRTPFSSGLATIVRRTLVTKAATSSSEAISRLLHSAVVSVNPRYGTWTATATSAGLVPPASPAAGSIPNAAANLPLGSSTPASSRSNPGAASSAAQG